jgi:hypothetical protein
MQGKCLPAFLFERRDDRNALGKAFLEERVFFANGFLALAARPVKFYDDLGAWWLFHAHAEDAVLVGIELKIFTGRPAEKFFDRVEDEVGSELIKKILLVRHVTCTYNRSRAGVHSN